MHRFYLPPEECQGKSLCLGGSEAHHAQHVLRIRPGETVTVLDGAGGEFLCQVQECQGRNVTLAVAEKRQHTAPASRITLLQAVPKGKLMEAIIQKATELGAWRIVPLLSERVVAQFDEEQRTHKADKWQQVATEAIKQCGCAWLPKVEAPVTPEQFLARNEAFELPLIASLQSGSRHPREYFRAFRDKEGRMPASLSVWIGPEGDWSPAETTAITAHGALPITLGPLVLRVETAATYCLSILNYELQAG
jgi:16S rRNA (uracil1498-N3)-methyltransferase